MTSILSPRWFMPYCALSLGLCSFLPGCAAEPSDAPPQVTEAADDTDEEDGDIAVKQAALESCAPFDGDPVDAADCPSADTTFPLTTLCANGMNFSVRMGGPETGEPVLLLHGFPESSYEWIAQLRALANAGYRVIAPDQRGYSPGARPDAVSEYTVSKIAADALAIATAAGAPRFHLVAHDWGGQIGWYIAQTAPERVISYAAVSTPAPQAMKLMISNPFSCQHTASAYYDIVSLPDSEDLLLAFGGVGLAALYLGMPDDSRCVHFNTLNSKPALGHALDWYRANIVNRQMQGTLATKVTRPTLLIWGDQDPFFCGDTVLISGFYVSAPYQLAVIPGAGHWLPELNASRVTQLLLAHINKY